MEELKQLLASTDDLSMPLDELPTQYEEYFEKSFNLKCHGLLCLEDLKDKLIGFIEVSNATELPEKDISNVVVQCR